MDWKTLISDLMEAGLTQAEIGKEVGLSQPAVSELVSKRTADVKWSVGEKLLTLHRDRCMTQAAA